MFFISLVHSVFAGTDISGTYVLQTPMSEIETQKKNALEKTVQSADWLYQIPLQMRLKDKPNICQRYIFEMEDSFFYVTCDALNTLKIPMSGKKEHLQRTIDGQVDEITVVFYQKEYIAYEIFSGQGSMYIEIHPSDSNVPKKITVSKTIKSSYFKVPYVVDMTYMLSSKL